VYYRISANAARLIYRVRRRPMDAQMALLPRGYSRVAPRRRMRGLNLRKGYPLDSNEAIHAP
jgi:hypothetical protein